ncbi:phosphoglycerate mutase [Dyella sp.]|uniref:phosphoglycerate mutase n=1 Tax=Dyella sp. TaxID=1869338 RepID=UPI002ED3D535
MLEIAAESLLWWLPDLARFDASHPLRSMVVRADALSSGPRGYLGGLEAFFTISGGLPAAALTRELLAADAGDAVWLSADPAWIQPDLNGARLLACGHMGLSMDQASELAEPLLPLFAEAGMSLELSSPDRWHVRLPAGSTIPDFVSPERALGEDLFQHLPQGVEGKRWRLLLNDAQILLHQHPVNQLRRQQALPPVNSLWLWGGGSLPGRVETSLRGVIGDDVLLGALATRAGLVMQPRTSQALEQAHTGTLIDLQDLPAETIAEAWWPALRALAVRHRVLLVFASGERWLHRPWHRWRAWRKAMR